MNLSNMHRVLHFCLMNFSFLKTRRSLFIHMNLVFTDSLCVVDKNPPYWLLRRIFLFSLKFGRGHNAAKCSKYANATQTSSQKKLKEKGLCYTSQLKCFFRLEEKMSRVVGQKPTNSLGKQQPELFIW